jgi:hypothetical protein
MDLRWLFEQEQIYKPMTKNKLMPNPTLSSLSLPWPHGSDKTIRAFYDLRARAMPQQIGALF